MNCPFLQFERECVGADCPLFVHAHGQDQAACGLKVLVSMCSAYSRDRHRWIEEMDSLGKRISRKIDEMEAGARHRW
jgi:hypothetical protein